MKIKLLSYTRLNPALIPLSTAGISDLSTLWQASNSTDPEKVIEYAARTCYRSNARMGSSPGFIADCVQRGHMDVIEHGWATFGIYGDWNNPRYWRQVNRYVEVNRHHHYDIVVSGNFRVWRDLLSLDYAKQMQPYLAAIAPAVFGDATQQVDTTLPALQVTAPVYAESGPMRVTLLGYSHPGVGVGHSAATFLFEGISRTCTHQLVRHRLGSFSMESQRYVDLDKGQWGAIIPPSVEANGAAWAVMQDFWGAAESAYAKLLALGIRKEDARFLLPNAAETRIVTTMNFAGWQHFFELRALDKAAQWEIRRMAQLALGMLAQVAPDVFGSQMATCQSRFPAAS